MSRHLPEKTEIWQAQFNARLISAVALEALLFGTGLRDAPMRERVREYESRRKDFDSANSRRK